MAERGGSGTERRQLRALGDHLIDALLQHEEGMAALVGSEIRRRIEAGDLVETDELVVGGATMVRSNELEELRMRLRVLDDAVYRAQLLGDEGDFRAAMAVLDEVRPPEEVLDDDEDEDEPVEDDAPAEPGDVDDESEDDDADDAPAADQPAAPKRARERVRVRVPPAHRTQVEQRNQTGGGDGRVEVEPSGRPVGMPTAERLYSCSACDDDQVPLVQAQLSWTRTREVRCRPCLASWKEPVGGPLEDDEAPEEADREPQTTVA